MDAFFPRPSFPILKQDDKTAQRVSDLMLPKLSEWYEAKVEFYSIQLTCLSEMVESPIEMLLGAALMDISWGWGNLDFDMTFGEQNGDPEWGAYYCPQVQLGPYRFDFGARICLRGKRSMLVIEADGHDFHERTKEQAARDKARDRWLTMEEIPFLRFTGSEIYKDAQACADQVSEKLGWMAHNLLVELGIEKPRKRREPE